AGTTGAGKSEFLQTLVANLALTQSPRDVQLLLIDYKGGATFQDFDRLPHVAGMLTDLDEHHTERALRSLRAELRRREKIFAAAKSRNIDEHRRTHGGSDVGR